MKVLLPYGCAVWVNATSSNVLGYGVKGEDLIVMFKGGQGYKYDGMKEHFVQLYLAESTGKYINENVKSAKCEKVRDVSELAD